MKKKIQILLTILFAIFLLRCAGSSQISVKVLKPAAIHMPGIYKVAVVDFEGPEMSGSQVATMMQSMLMQTQHYEIMERENLKRILEEQNLGMAGILDETTAVQVGKVLGVDALIFGQVSQYEVPPDKKITKKVKEKKFTGKYETVEEKGKDGKVVKKKKKIYEDVWIDREYWVREGNVAVNFRVVNVETGQLLAAHSESKSYNSEKNKSFWQSMTSSQADLKPAGEILSNLSKSICTKFTKMIAPYHVSEKRTIESGEGDINTGKQFAESGLWPEAIESWERAVKQQPNEPAGYYNLGLAYELNGDLDRAEAAFIKAVGLNQKKLYMDSIARVRKAKVEQAKLQEQLSGRENSLD